VFNENIVDLCDLNQFKCLNNGTCAVNLFIYLCIWLSSCIAFERGLFIWLDTKLYTRWRSCVAIIVILAIAVGSAMPLLVYNCDWNNIPALATLNTFFNWFYIIAGIAVYVVVTLLALISFARRIHYYGMENGSWIKNIFQITKISFINFRTTNCLYHLSTSLHYCRQ
jgi:hypothetical protein